MGRPTKQQTEAIKLNKLKQLEINRLNRLIERQDDGIKQGIDQINDLLGQVEFYRKQVNHLLALLNILSRGA